MEGATALLSSMESLISGPQGAFQFSPFKNFARKYNQLVEAVAPIAPLPPMIEKFALDQFPTPFESTGIEQRNIFYSVHANLSVLKSFLENRVGHRADKVSALTDFIAVSLRKVIFKEPTKEVDVQDGVEQLLIGRGLEKGVDYDRESGRVKVSIKEVVPDFNFQTLGLALEVKLSKDRAKSKVLVDEINADIMAYGKKYSFLNFVVYDLGSIRDEVEFKQDLDSKDGVSVTIVKH